MTNFNYDKDYFTTLKKHDKYKYITKHINTLAKDLNDPSLKANYKDFSSICYLYSDGTIIIKTGDVVNGKKYGNILENHFIKPNTFFSFPNRTYIAGDTYAILTLEKARQIKALIIDMLNKC